MNQFKTMMLLAALAGLLVAIGGAVGGRAGALVAFGLALAVNGITYWCSDSFVLSSQGGVEVSQSEEPRLHNVVEELAIRAGIPRPRVYVIEARHANAFATGRNPEHAAVAVTRGLLGTMNDEELAGVIAHELSHVRNRDTLVQCVAAAIAGAISLLAMMARVSLWFVSGGRRRAEGMTLLVVALLAPLAAFFIQMAISRSREYAADESAARLMGTGRGLVSALRKLAPHIGAVRTERLPTAAHIYIVNPFKADGPAGLFRTHPRLEDRIARLTALEAEL